MGRIRSTFRAAKERAKNLKSEDYVVERPSWTFVACLAGLTALVGYHTHKYSCYKLSQSAVTVATGSQPLATAAKVLTLVFEYQALFGPEEIDEQSASFHGPWKGLKQHGTAISLLTHESVPIRRIIRGIRENYQTWKVPNYIVRGLNSGKYSVQPDDTVCLVSQSGEGRKFTYYVDASSGAGVVKAIPSVEQKLSSFNMNTTFRDSTSQDAVADEIMRRHAQANVTTFGGSHGLVKQDVARGPEEVKQMQYRGNGMYQEISVSASTPDSPPEAQS